MKNTSIIILSTLVLAITLFSCSVEKRLYNKGYAVEWHRGIKTETKNSETVKPDITEPEGDLATLESDFSVEMQPAILEEPACDTIKLKNGETKLGVVQEVGIWGITYKDCDGSGPARVIENSSVKSIRYSNGKEEIIPDPTVPDQKTQSTPAEKTKVVEGFGVAGFIFSIIGFFVAGIPLGIAAIIFGIISMGRIASYPSKYKGAAFGIIALILGLVVLILTLAIVL